MMKTLASTIFATFVVVAFGCGATPDQRDDSSQRGEPLAVKPKCTDDSAQWSCGPDSDTECQEKKWPDGCGDKGEVCTGADDGSDCELVGEDPATGAALCKCACWCG